MLEALECQLDAMFEMSSCHHATYDAIDVTYVCEVTRGCDEMTEIIPSSSNHAKRGQMGSLCVLSTASSYSSYAAIPAARYKKLFPSIASSFQALSRQGVRCVAL